MLSQPFASASQATHRVVAAIPTWLVQLCHSTAILRRSLFRPACLGCDPVLRAQVNLAITGVNEYGLGIPMRKTRVAGRMVTMCMAMFLAGCGGLNFRGSTPSSDPETSGRERGQRNETTLGEALRARRNQESIVRVNKYIWSASLQVLDFLPIQSVDPFTGVIVTGFGTPPGGGRAYRATVLISDPALDARSLNVALQTRNGPASTATVRAIEDAILTRARQLRVADNRL